MSISADQIVRIIPSVLAAGGNALQLNGVFCITEGVVPIGSVYSYPDTDSVAAVFGADSLPAKLAAIYFAGYNNAQSLPSAMLFATHNQNAVGAYLRSGSFLSVTLAQLQAFSGVLNLLVDGGSVQSANINLATATSFSNAATLMQTGLTAVGTAFQGNGHIDDGIGGNGNTLTVTAVTSGALRIGSVVAAPEFDPGTTITAFLTGTGGVGTYTVGGTPQNSGAAAFTSAANVQVAYDAQLHAFVISSPSTGVDSTIGFASGSLSTSAKFTSAAGAILSQGADASTPAVTMDRVKQATTNWASFTCLTNMSIDDMLAFALWVQGQNSRYVFVAYDFDDSAATSNDAPDSFARQCEANSYSGVIPIFEVDLGDGVYATKAAFVMGMIASIAFNQAKGRIDFAFKAQDGLTPDVTDSTTASNLLANGYNFYGNYATDDDQFSFFYRGSMPGSWKWADTYVNQIWLSAALQLSLIELMVQVNSLPYNNEGYNLLRNAVNDPDQRAKLAGVVQAGVTLSNSQRAQISSLAGAGVANVIQNTGSYLQILDAAPEVRAARGSPPMRYWYTDGGSIQKIELPSIAIQ